MSTRSTIAIEVGANRYKGIYCHGDGYPKHNGVLLVKHYNTPEAVQALIDLGNISYLGKNFELPPGVAPRCSNDTTIAYARDYGEEYAEAEEMTLEELDRAENGSVYVYLFTKDAEWKYFHVGHLNEGLCDLKNDVERFLAPEEEEQTYDGESIAPSMTM